MVAENWFFRNFLDEIRPSYQAPSRYVLSHSIMDSEVARVQIADIARLKERKRLTLLLDGWEDKIRRSLYGCLAAEVNQHPVVLSLEDMTGHRGSADKLLEVSVKALERMEIGDGRNIIAATTDNPTVMQAFRRKFQAKFFWVLVSTSPPLIHLVVTYVMILDIPMLSPWAQYHYRRNMCTPIYETTCDKSNTGGYILQWITLLGGSVERAGQKGWHPPWTEEKLRVSLVRTGAPVNECS